MDLRFNMALDVYSVLTKNQKEKVWEKFEEMKPPFKGKKGPGKT